jgi:glycosyltransferase involved in cell wall biosynthesis
MKISIITPTLNHAKYIEDTILSVKNQDYSDFEHIIIDGGSTDSTLDILKKYPHLIWISEKDTGQSNAINKGFKMASGDILAWINSDDYYEKNIFSQIVDFFENNKECYFLYGDQIIIDENKNVLGFRSGEDLSLQNLLKNPDIVRQPVCFWRKEVINTIGYLNESLHLVMDYDLFLRIAKKYDFYHIDNFFCYFRDFKGTKSRKLAKQQVNELRSVMKKESKLINYRFYIFMFNRKVILLKNKMKTMIGFMFRTN